MSRYTQPVLRVEAVSKKFCRSLRRSLRYGLVDVALELGGRGGGERPLRRDEFWALRDVSFELHPGDCLGLIGHNGAGKTTLLRMLAGLIKPDGGRIEARGRIAAMIALGAGFNPALTGRENIHVNGALLGMTRAEISRKLDWIVDFSGLGTFIDAPVQTYSSGMTVRLGFSIATATEPDVLILDEVLAVGDMAFRAKCQARLNEVRQSGGALILVTHSMEQVAHHCNRALLLDHGVIAAEGPTRNVIDEYYSFLGKSRIDTDKRGSPPPSTSPFESFPHYNPLENRWGDGRATIVDVNLIQSEESWPTVVVPGVTVSVAMTIRYHDNIVNPIIGLTMKNEDGAEVFHTNTRMLRVDAMPDGEPGTTIQAMFEFQPFLPIASYMLSLGIASETEGMVVPHDRRYDCIRMEIGNPLLASGDADMKPKFHLLGAN